MADLTDAERGLLAAAATGSLGAGERAALDALLVREPSAAAELEDLRGALAALEPLRAPGAQWSEDADPWLGDRVLSATQAPQAPRATRAAWYALAASALLLVGGLGGAGLRGVLEDRPTAGQPGTLGAREALAVQTASADVTASAAVVAHTWGTETFLDVAGLPVGVTYRVVVLDEAGNAVVAGTFIGSERTVECVMNAAVLRQEASGLEVLDPAGSVVVSSELPPTA